MWVTVTCKNECCRSFWEIVALLLSGLVMVPSARLAAPLCYGTRTLACGGDIDFLKKWVLLLAVASFLSIVLE